MKQITALLGIILLSAGIAFSEELGVRLTGTIIGGDNTFAFIEDIATGEQGIYRSGDSLKEYRIIRIIKDRITLTSNAGKIVLIVEGTDNPDGLSPHLSGEIKPVYQAGIQGGVYELAANRLADILNNVSSYKGKVRVYQHHEGGKKAGFRIRYLTNRKDFEKMGIKNGDIIRKVNGLDINNTSDILKVVYKLSYENRFEVEVKRESEKKILHYRLDERLDYLVPIVYKLLNMPEGRAEY